MDMSRLRRSSHRAVLRRAVFACVAAAGAAALGCGGDGIAEPTWLSADARAARAAALRFDSLLAHSPVEEALDAVRGDWLSAAIEATAYGAAPRPVTVMINGKARSFEAVALNRVVRSSEGVDVDSMLTMLAWRGDAVSEAILLQWHGGTPTSGPLSSFHAVYHPRGTFQLGADEATLGPWMTAATAGQGATAGCTRTRTSHLTPAGICAPGTLALEAGTSFRAPHFALEGQRRDTFVVVLPAVLLSAPRVVVNR